MKQDRNKLILTISIIGNVILLIVVLTLQSLTNPSPSSHDDEQTQTIVCSRCHGTREFKQQGVPNSRSRDSVFCINCGEKILLLQEHHCVCGKCGGSGTVQVHGYHGQPVGGIDYTTQDPLDNIPNRYGDKIIVDCSCDGGYYKWKGSMIPDFTPNEPYGPDDYMNCSNCGERINRHFDHFCECRKCNGKGYIETQI